MHLLLVSACIVTSCVQISAQTGFDSAAPHGAISAMKFYHIHRNLRYNVFIGQYYNGALVVDPNSIAGIMAGLNYNGIRSIRNARKAWWSKLVDAYHVPKFTVSAPLLYSPTVGMKTNVYAQARHPVDSLILMGARIGRTWIVVSQTAGSNWSPDTASNQRFLTEFLSYFPSLGPQVGILTNAPNFQAIFGSSYVPLDGNGQRIELWWQNCSGTPGKNGFVQFNGWTSPTMHQYKCAETNIGAQLLVDGNIDWLG